MDTIFNTLLSIGDSSFVFKKSTCRHNIVKGIIALEDHWKTEQQVSEVANRKEIMTPLAKSMVHLNCLLEAKTYTDEKTYLHIVVAELRAAVEQCLASEEVGYAQRGHLQIMLAYTWLLLGAKNDARTYLLHAQKNYQKLYSLIQEEIHEVNLLIKYPNIQKVEKKKANNDFVDMGLDIGLDIVFDVGMGVGGAFVPGASLMKKYAKKAIKTNVLSAIETDDHTTLEDFQLTELNMLKSQLVASQQEIEQYVDFLQDVLYILPSVDTTVEPDKMETIKQATKNAFAYSTTVVGNLKETIADDKLKNTVTGLFKRASKNNDEQRS